MPLLQNNLILDRCPHCSVANPNVFQQHRMETKDHAGKNHRWWYIYKCAGCGGVVTASSTTHNAACQQVFPSSRNVSNDLPEKAKSYLEQAIASLHAPAGAVMLAASAVDSMLKAKDYLDGSLYKRIEAAVADNLLTNEMATWAHDVRLDANDQRHADEDAGLPTTQDAARVIDFVSAIAEYLFVLPAKVKRGIAHQ